jgi:hypothetical protein
MNKKDFWTLMLFNIGTIILLMEHWCKLELAIYCLCVWTIISLIVHICVLRDYVRIYISSEEY